MRVLHVIPSVAPSDGGPSRAIGVIEQALTKAGVAVVTLTTDHDQSLRGPNIEERDCANGKVTRFYARKRTDFYKIAPGMLPWLWQNVRAFDAVHIHALFSFSSLAAGLIAFARGVPFIIRPLGTLTRYGMQQRAFVKALSFRLLEGPLLKRAAAVHFTSEDEWAEANALDIPLRGTMIPLGVEDTGKGSFARFDAAYPFVKGRSVVLFLSRLDPKKNLEALLHGFAACGASAPSPVLVIAGAGSEAYTESLKARAARLGLQDRVLWLSHIDGDAKADALARADVFALPSYSENFGIAAVEAMLAGLPCVLGEGVAVATKAADEGAAIAIEPNAEALTSALQQLLDDEPKRRQIGQAARAHALRHYSEEAMAGALKDLYVTLSASSRKACP